MLEWIVVVAGAAALGAGIRRVAGRRERRAGRPPSAGRAERLEHWSGPARRWDGRLRRPRQDADDPFVALDVQMRLSRLSAELDALHSGREGFARGFHLVAAQDAYDRTLEEGCRLAGVHEIDAEGPVRRLLAESALRAKGWTW